MTQSRCYCGHTAQDHSDFGCESCAVASDDFFDQCLGYQPDEEP